MSERPRWHKWAAIGLATLVVVVVVAFWGRLRADFWPPDRSFVGPNIVASAVLFAGGFILAVLFYPSWRRAVSGIAHRFVDGKLEAVHSKLELLHDHHERHHEALEQLAANHEQLLARVEDLHTKLDKPAPRPAAKPRAAPNRREQAMTVATVRLETRGVDVKLGKQLATLAPSPDTIRMADVIKLIPASALNLILAGAVPPGLPTVPDSGWGWGFAFGAANWGMDGNGPAGPDSNLPTGSSAYQNGAGDCWWAMLLHRLRLWGKLAKRPIPEISDLTLLTQYAAYVASINNGQGYDIQTGANDLGTDPLGAYQYLATSPLYDDAGNKYPVGQIVSLTAGNVQEHVVSTRLFEGTGVGVQLQQAQVDQFDQGQPLAYVKGSPVVGGHELLQAGPNGMVEWGEHTPFDPSFIEKCNDQSEATLGVEMFNAVTGDDATGADELDVEKYAAAFVAALPA